MRPAFGGFAIVTVIMFRPKSLSSQFASRRERLEAENIAAQHNASHDVYSYRARELVRFLLLNAM